MPRRTLLILILLFGVMMTTWGKPQPDAPTTHAHHEAARAIFAGGTCNDECSIEISGAEGYIEGGTHSNGGSCVSSGYTIVGPNSVVNPNCPPATCIEPPPDIVAPIPMPTYYQITDFDETTDPLPTLAGNRYYHLMGNFTLPQLSGAVTDTVMASGALIYVDGNVDIAANRLHNFTSYNFTLVATGRIQTGGGTFANRSFNSYTSTLTDGRENLLFYSSLITSGCSGRTDSGIEIIADIFIGTGMLYAPDSGIYVSGSEPTIYGALVGRYIYVSAGNGSVIFTGNTTPHTPTPSDTPTHTPTFTLTPSDTPSNTPTLTACIGTASAPTLVRPSHRSHTTDTTPRFDWNGVSGAQSYRLMVYLEDRIFIYKKRTFETPYTLKADEALVAGKYIWRVRTQDNTCGTWSLWSKRYTLFVD